MAVTKSTIRDVLRAQADTWAELKDNFANTVVPQIEAIRLAGGSLNSPLAANMAVSITSMVESLQTVFETNVAVFGDTVGGTLALFSDFLHDPDFGSPVKHNRDNSDEIKAAFLEYVRNEGEYFDARDINYFDTLNYSGQGNGKIIVETGDLEYPFQMVNIEQAELRLIDTGQGRVDAEGWLYTGGQNSFLWEEIGSLNLTYQRIYNLAQSNKRAIARWELGQAQASRNVAGPNTSVAINTIRPYASQLLDQNAARFVNPLLANDTNAQANQWYIVSGGSDISLVENVAPDRFNSRALRFEGDGKVGVIINRNNHTVNQLRFIDAMVKRSGNITGGTVTLAIEGFADPGDNLTFSQDIMDFGTSLGWFDDNLIYRLKNNAASQDLRLTIAVTGLTTSSGDPVVDVVTPVGFPLLLIAGVGYAILPGTTQFEMDDVYEIEHTLGGGVTKMTDFMAQVWRVNVPTDGFATDQYWTDTPPTP